MYHKHLRNITIALGSLLNSFNVSIGKMNVPVSFASKNRFVAKLKNSQHGVQTFLPRIGFNMEGIVYDSERQQQKNQIVTKNGKRSVTPVPYVVDFNVGIYTKSMDEGLEILEQLLPSFTPYYNLKITETKDLDIITDVPLTLNSVTLQDNWEGSFEGSDLRTILWELSLSAPVNLFPTIKDKGAVINTVTLNFGLIGDNWYEPSQKINFNGYAKLIAEANVI